MSIVLRHYQEDCRSAVFQAWRTVMATLTVLPTGTGKSAIFAAIIKKMRPAHGIAPLRSIVICHREELVDQAKHEIETGTGLTCEVEQGQRKVTDGLYGHSDVVIATVQTLNAALTEDHKRMSKFDPHQFNLLVCDEAHHATAATWKNIIHYFRQNPDLRVLATTATPDRTDEEALSQVFESVAYKYEILDAIQDGWLVPVEEQMVTISGLDFSHIRTTAGDLNKADLAAVMEAESNLHGVASATMDIIGNEKRTMVFAASVKQAETLSNIFNRHRSGSAFWICGKTNKEERRKLLGQFSKGEFQIAVNVGCLTEGYNNPQVEYIVMAKPTKSRCLFAQICGRSLRPLPGVVDQFPTAEERRAAIAASPKPCARIIDFAGNAGKHKLVCTADILGGKCSDDVIKRTMARMVKLGKPVNVIEAIKEEEEKELNRKKAEEARLLERARKANVTAKVTYKTSKVDAFDLLDVHKPKYNPKNDGKVVSEKIKKILRDNGIEPDDHTYAENMALFLDITRRWKFDLARPKQIALLARFGYDAKQWPAKQASSTIDQIKANGWKRLGEAA